MSFFQTELRFIHSKPTCFIVIGKPGAGKTSLVRRLAAEWKCELINRKHSTLFKVSRHSSFPQ